MEHVNGKPASQGRAGQFATRRHRFSRWTHLSCDPWRSTCMIYNVASGKSVARLDVNVASALDESAKGINGAHFTLGTHARATVFLDGQQVLRAVGRARHWHPADQVCSVLRQTAGHFSSPARRCNCFTRRHFPQGRPVGCFSPAAEVIQVFDIESGKIIRRLRNSLEKDWSGGAVQLAF